MVWNLHTKDFSLSSLKAVMEIKNVESRRPSLKDENLRLWVPHTADFCL